MVIYCYSPHQVEEDLALDAWNGFGIDEEDVLGSRHFRRSGAGAAGSSGKRPSHGGLAPPLMMAGGAAANGSVPQQPVPSDSPRGQHHHPLPGGSLGGGGTGINGLAQIRTKVAPQHRWVRRLDDLVSIPKWKHRWSALFFCYVS